MCGGAALTVFWGEPLMGVRHRPGEYSFLLSRTFCHSDSDSGLACLRTARALLSPASNIIRSTVGQAVPFSNRRHIIIVPEWVEDLLGENGFAPCLISRVRTTCTHCLLRAVVPVSIYLTRHGEYD